MISKIIIKNNSKDVIPDYIKDVIRDDDQRCHQE